MNAIIRRLDSACEHRYTTPYIYGASLTFAKTFKVMVQAFFSESVNRFESDLYSSSVYG